MVDRLKLEEPLELELPDGQVVRIQPGPYRRGVSIVPIGAKTPQGAGDGKRGRKPRPGTVKLRERLEREIKDGTVLEPREYVRWLLREDPSISLSVARQVVYRELRVLDA